MAKPPIQIYKFEEIIYYRLKDLRAYAHKKFPIGQKCYYKCGWQEENMNTYFTNEKVFVIKAKFKK